MGALTRGQVVSEGLQLAADTSLGLRGNVWLNNFLQSVGDSYDWPQLTGRYGPFVLPLGATSFTLGDGTNTPDKLLRVTRAAIAETTNTGFKGSIEIVSRDSISPADDPAWLDLNSKSTPRKLLRDMAGDSIWKWVFYPTPVPDKAYRLLFAAQRRPEELTSDAQYPWYPNDQTLVHAVYVSALRHQQDERALNEASVLESMVSADRTKYKGNDSPTLRLSETRFPRRNDHPDWWR